MKAKKGITLVELIAVLVILAVILAITVPSVNNIINDATKNAFQADAALVLQAIEREQLRDETFDITLINKSNFTELLEMSSKQYKSIVVSIVNNRAYIVIVGTDKWEGLVASGNFDGITVVKEENYTGDIEPPVITIIGESSVTIGIGDVYVDQGATAFDNVDGDITYKIVVSNNVDSSIAGSYRVIYNVTDAAGNIATPVVRSVTVRDAVFPVITLNGSNPIDVPLGTQYIDPGATATDDIDGDITDQIIVTGTVNTSVIGTYSVTYTVRDASGNKTTEIRTVNVVDNNPPVIAVSMNGNEVYAKSRSTTVTVTDDYSSVDADSLKYIWNTSTTTPDETSFVTPFINNDLLSTPPGVTGGYYLWILAKDINGNTVIQRTNVFNLDNTKPVITIIGNNPETHSAGATYSDAGATAIDNIDGTITSSIVTTGTVNVNTKGTYTITYNVVDSAGNEETATRTVNVVDTTSPTIAFGLNGSTTYAKSRSTTVTVSDAHSSLSTLRYLWNTSTTTPTEASFTTSFANGTSLSTPGGVTGGYYLWILAKDSDGNTKIQRTNVFNLDNTIPIITVVGDNPKYHSVGTAYSDAGATATDNISGDITGSISTSGSVNVSTPGTYTITYNVSDSSGNAATTETRTVYVIQSAYTYSYTGSSTTFTAVAPGTYKLEVWGAGGGTNGSAIGGTGAKIIGNFNLTASQVLTIYVGGKGADGGGNTGGTGGEATYIEGTSLLIMAGGGGGGVNSTSANGGNASTGINGTAGNRSNTSYSYTPGTNGHGGGAGTGAWGTAGGGGWLSAGTNSSSRTGGRIKGGSSIGHDYAGGAGGGYSGGAGASMASGWGVAGGGGGGSYNAGTNQSNSIGNVGNGYASITFIGQ